MNQHKVRNDLTNLTSSQAGFELSKDVTERVFSLFQDTERLSHLASRLKNVDGLKSQGHMFEQLETIKFNFDALLKDSDLVAKTTAEMGLPHAPADIVIMRGRATLREIQAKSYGEKQIAQTPLGKVHPTTSALADPKYEGMGRLAPADQAERVGQAAEKLAKTNTIKASQYADVAENNMETLSHEGVASRGTTYEEALNSTNSDTAKRISTSFKSKSTLVDMHQSGMKGGVFGATFGGGVSIVINGTSYVNGDIDLGKALVNTSIDAAKGFAGGYTVTAMSKGMVHTSSLVFGETFAKALTKSNAPIAMAAGVISASKSLVKYAKGDIEGEELLSEISHTAITSTSAFYYGALGQVAIPIPVVGAIIGAGVGYFIGNMLHSSGLLALGEAEVVKLAREQRQRIEAICLASIERSQKEQRILQNYFDTYFAERKEAFDEAFFGMDNAITTWDADQFVQSLEVINQQFGAALQFKSLSEFSTFMKSGQTFKF